VRSAKTETPYVIPWGTWFTVITAFWIYSCFTRTAQWELMRRSLPERWLPSLEAQMGEHIVLYVALLILCLLTRRLGYELRNWRRVVPVHLALAIVFGLLERPALIIGRAVTESVPLAQMQVRMDSTDITRVLHFYGSATIDAASQYLVLQVLLAALAFYMRYRDEQSQREKLAVQYERARVQALRMQINPHFLFNTLSAIAGLIRENPTAAEGMVTRLGDLFRRTLTQRNVEFIPLSQELEHGKQYLEIQQARFEERLRFCLSSEPELERAAIPPLLLQPLLENAVEHGITGAEGAVQIDVLCTAPLDKVEIVVRNRGEPLALAVPKRNLGVGLESVRQRLSVAYGAAASFNVEQHTPGEFVVRLQFPRRECVAPAQQANAA
jgi:two-component system LytT family sensor kinase